MDPFTIIAGVTLLATFFKGAYDFTRGIQEQEKQSKLEEQGKDPASLAEKQLQLNENVSTENLELAKQQFQYQQDLNQKVMDREDSAFQRQMADLKAAGLSPLALSGGASANPLQSAQPVQRDVSGINQAMQNMIGAYNDMFNRNMQKRQFALQSKVQTAQAYTQLAELSMQRKRANLENKILGLDYEYYYKHPERNLGLQQIFANALSAALQRNPSALNTNIGGLPNPITFGSGNNDSPGLFNLSGSTKSYVTPPSPRQIKSDQKKLNDKNKTDYQNAVDILANYSGKEYQESSLLYIYRHTDAWREYEHLSDFKNALLNVKDKLKFLSKYPYINRESPF